MLGLKLNHVSKRGHRADGIFKVILKRMEAQTMIDITDVHLAPMFVTDVHLAHCGQPMFVNATGGAQTHTLSERYIR